MVKTRFITAGFSGALAILNVLFLVSCGYHQPAPVEEHSSVPVKRHMNPGGSYTVRSGDTLYGIAFNYGMDPRDLAQWNRISSPYIIYPGQKLQLSAPPSGRRDSGASSAVKISPIKAPGKATTRPESRPQTPSRAQTSKTNPTAPATVDSSSKSAVPVKPLPAQNTDPASWQWPTSGRVLRAYVAGDPARNGLDIAGAEGQAVTATAAGQVVYSGNGLIGYGELIIIKHSENMLSAYAHNKVRLVKEGEQVSAGQKIAEMGRNAGNEEILHFEIRSRGKPVNPLIYLPKK